MKTSTSRRTIEITRSLAAALALAGPGRTFAHLTHASADKAWRRALKRAKIADPQQRCTISATHVSGLIADGWDPVEIAARIGDTLQTTLTVYSHEFDARRRGDQRRAALEARYDGGMATDTPQHTATSGSADVVEMTAVQAVRDRVG